MLQHYGVGEISDVIHDVTTVIYVISQDSSVTYLHVHSMPGAKQCVWAAQKFLRGYENIF